MLKVLNQMDGRWGRSLINGTNLTLARWGCLITCLSMMTEYFKCSLPPNAIAAKPWFNKDGKLIWGKSEFEHMKFINRAYGKDDSEILWAIKNPDTCIALEVMSSHWVLAVGTSIWGGYRIFDPMGGIITTTRKYKNQITGHAIYQIK